MRVVSLACHKKACRMAKNREGKLHHFGALGHTCIEYRGTQVHVRAPGHILYMYRALGHTGTCIEHRGTQVHV